jgi:Carboxypeptidase regulatory-like domain/TonB-dependent Receptor Plug Domain
MRIGFEFRSIALGVVFLFCVFIAAGQTGNSGSIEGVLKDPSGGAVANATVEITNAVSGYTRTAASGPDGTFRFTNIPLNPYHLTVTATGFAPYVQDVEVRSTVPVNLQVPLKIGTEVTSVTVESNGGDLVEDDPTTHTDVDRNLFDRLPLENTSSSLSSLVTLASPGVSADSNGLFHGFGDHASNSFSIDGQPITDQQSKVFSNQLPLDSVQSLEVIEGAPPAEYGGKTSLVIVATTRSGLGVNNPHGEVTASYGSFGTVNGGFNLAYGTDKWGNFVSANGLDTGRFLDGPELGVMHDRGNEENFFDRVDYKLSAADTISINLGYSRSWFQTPNSYDAQEATGWSFNSAYPTCPPGQIANCGGLGPSGLPVGSQDQRSKIGTFNISPSWTRLINAETVLTVAAWVRRDGYNYYPSADPFADYSPDLQFNTVEQYRTLTNAGIRSNVSYVKGKHNFKAGIDFENTALHENDKFGIVDPTVNVVCLTPVTSLGTVSYLPNTNPTLTDPAQCAANGLVSNTGQGPVPAFIPLLGCYDLTRTAPLPASDGCPAGQTASTLYNFLANANIKESALYAQDTITVKNWSFNLGVRVDIYRGISSATQGEPRLGIAYNIKPTNTVLRVSYARTMESPFNENLILASTGCNYPVIFDLQSSVPGGECVSSSVPPLSPGKRNEFHAGLEQAFGKYLVIDGEYIWKYTTRAFDFSVLGDTPITYPIEWSRSKIPGYAIRASVPNVHGFTAYLVTSSVAARFFGPQISGIGATPGAEVTVFRIDHDELHNATGHLQYQPWKRGPWVGFNWRYDSGLVAGPVPCYNPDTATCAGTSEILNGVPTVILSGLTGDQQMQAGIFCNVNGVLQLPTLSSPLSSCPAAGYGATRVSIPAPGTENDDHNPQRIKPRNLFDIAVGHDNLFHGDRYKWSLRLTAVNVTDKVALYNFISTFSGTHFVTPRALTAELGFHF